MAKLMLETPEGFGELCGRISYSDGTVKALVRFEGDQWPSDRSRRLVVTVAFDLDQVRLPAGVMLADIDLAAEYVRG